MSGFERWGKGKWALCLMLWLFFLIKLLKIRYMEIEIITTKKKISKSIINQILNYKLSNFENIVCLGYLTNISKVSNKYLLLKNTVINEYFKMPFGLYKYIEKKYVGIWKWSYEIEFETYEFRDLYFSKYTSLCENANHIIY